MNEQTPVFALGNVKGAPLVTAGGVIAGAGQYLISNGAVIPHDTQTWIQFGLGLLLAILGAITRAPSPHAS